MGDITELANLLIGKAEQYGQLLGSKTFPLFVQRQIFWGHVNQTLGWIAVGMLVVSILLVVIGAMTDRYDINEGFFVTAFVLFTVSIPMAIGCFVRAALQLSSPEFEALKSIIYLFTGGTK